MAEFKLKKGYDIPLEGAPSNDVVDAPVPELVALCPEDFLGVKFRLLVREGDKVKLGTPLLQSKAREDWVFASPAGGTVKAVNRGKRRVLQSIVIERAAEEEAETFESRSADQLAGLSREDALKQLLSAGLLHLFRERPFNYIANPAHTPRDIFVSAFDSAPLAADTALALAGNENAFQAGLDVCKALTTGKVHLSLDGSRSDLPAALTGAKNVTIHKFRGPHPAGCVGVQIHHIKPVKKREDVVWHINVQGLIVLGKLFLTGKFDPSILVAVGGSGATAAKHYRTRIGAQISSIVQGNVAGGELRYISGDVLTGALSAPDGFVRFYHNLISIIPEVAEAEFMGWKMPGFNKASWYRAFASKLFPGKKFAQHTGTNGGTRAFVINDHYESLVPMDILPVFLIKSCMYEDIDEMEQLGIYEVCEDEVALCEYICPSKIEFQKVVRQALDYIEKEG